MELVQETKEQAATIEAIKAEIAAEGGRLPLPPSRRLKCERL